MTDVLHSRPKSKHTPVILHLTDLHFGCDEREYDLARRELVLAALIGEVQRSPDDWRPTIVAVSGDIAWRGRAEDYSKASEWFGRLFSALGIDHRNLIACPGNHDADRQQALLLVRPEHTADADRVLATVPPSAHLQAPFNAFVDFCRQFRLPPLVLGAAESYLVGKREIDGVRFVCINSAWFSQGNDKGYLWLGLPLLHLMERAGHLPLLADAPSLPRTIAMFHHPREYLAESDIHSSPTGGRQAALDFLAHRSHAMLCGHVHSGIQVPDVIAGRSHYFVGGATYASAEYLNNARLIRVEPDGLAYRILEATPSSSEAGWIVRHPATRIPFEPTGAARPSSGGIAALAFLRDGAARHARCLVELKSRQMKPYGVLPNLAPLKVEVVTGQVQQTEDREQRRRSRSRLSATVPLYEAVRNSRRCLLLGDLGSGKSSILGLYAGQSMEQNEGTLALIVPVKDLHLPHELHIGALLDAVTDFLISRVVPGANTRSIALSGILREGCEVLLILDGLDEIPRALARRLLDTAAALVDHWPNIQVIAAARPVELAGFNYASWQILRLGDIHDDTRYQILFNEAVALGKDARVAGKNARQLQKMLRDRPALDALANTPLAIRLLYPRLACAPPSSDLSLGDLLHALLIERLSGWAEKDDKAFPWPEFGSSCPDGLSRAIVLGCLAWAACRVGNITIDQARACLVAHAEELGCPRPELFACQAIDCFEQSGIVVRDDDLRFPLQPLQETAAGLWIAEHWRRSMPLARPEPESWRAVSFAAAALRRAGAVESARQHLSAFLDAVLVDIWGIPVACAICCELEDRGVAAAIVKSLPHLGYRPLVWRHEESTVSARAIARTIFLAGDTGFNWLYDEYLDPRYPVINRGCAVIQSVFWAWALLARNHLTPEQRGRLALLVEPLRATSPIGAYGFERALVLLVPECFSANERLWTSSRLIGVTGVGHEAERLLEEALVGEHAAFVEDILRRYPGENALGTLLWLRLYPNERPSVDISRHLLLGAARASDRAEFQGAVSACREAVGRDRWDAFLRWTLGDPDRYTSAYAAVELHRGGQKALELIGSALWDGIHDGGYVAEAEESLLAAVQSEGRTGVEWLVQRFRHEDDINYGAHSGCWRVLLKTIGALAEDGPSSFAACAGKVGCFLLARFPEIRHGVRELISGTDGGSYRNALRRQLSHLNPDVRHGAAMLLVCADPEHEGEALNVVIRSRNRKIMGHWSEWESFLLTLRFGHGALAYLHQHVVGLDPRARLLALAVLASNGVPISEEERSELIIGTSDWSDRHLSTDALGDARLNSPTAQAILLSTMKAAPTGRSRYIADALLRFHRGTLSPADTARCIALRSDSFQIHDFLRVDLADMGVKSEMLDHVEKACVDLDREGADRCNLLAVVRALKSPDKWRDGLWALFCADLTLGDDDDVGECILLFGRRHPEHAKAIGGAAKDILKDPRLERNRWVDRYHWLALLAHEFVGLSVEDISDVLSASSAIHGSATYSLIARLGCVPPAFQRRAKAGDIPADVGAPIAMMPDSNIGDRLREAGRSSEHLHPNTCLLVEEAVWGGNVDEAMLNRIAGAGDNGHLISGVLRYCLGFAPSALDAVVLLDPFLAPAQTQNQCFTRLRRVGLLSQAARVRMDPEIQKAYLAQLDSALRIGDRWRHHLVYELLRVQKCLLPNQIDMVFDHLVSAHGRWVFDNEIVEMLAAWVIREQDTIIRGVIAEKAESAVRQLDIHPWDSQRGELRSPTIYLMFPLVCWACDRQVSAETVAVFLRGMRHLFDMHREDGPAASLNATIASVEPLLMCVPAEILKKVADDGCHSPDPAVRAWCYIIGEMAGAIRREEHCPS